MIAPLRIRHEGAIYEPFAPTAPWPDRFERGWGDPDKEEFVRRILNEGTFIDGEGAPVAPNRAAWTRKIILGDISGSAHVSRGLAHVSGPDGRRYLFDGLWPWGTYPMLGGAPKAGKTTLVADLVAALRVPGHPFLGQFHADLTEEERSLGVVVINAETPAQDFEDAVRSAGVDPDDSALLIYHLDELGGPDLFDLTDADRLDYWMGELMECGDCDGSDFWTPAVVIVDGVAAIMGSQDRYAEFYAAFKRLMKAADVPNGLATGHAVGDHLYDATTSMAGPDGIWIYTTRAPDDPSAARYFSVQPRMGGTRVPRARVSMVGDRLVMASVASKFSNPIEDEAQTTASRPVKPATRWGREVLDTLSKAGPAGALTKEITGAGRYGTHRREELFKLESEGVVVATAEGLGKRWRLSDFA